MVARHGKKLRIAEWGNRVQFTGVGPYDDQPVHSAIQARVVRDLEIYRTGNGFGPILGIQLPAVEMGAGDSAAWHDNTVCMYSILSPIRV